MIEMDSEQYKDVRLCNIAADEVFTVPDTGYTNLRVKTPALEHMQIFLTENGFFHADRMLKASINLKRTKIDFEKQIRLEVAKTGAYKERVREIALKSFPVDRRFHVDIRRNEETAAKLINGWVDKIDECYVCIYKDIAIGFAALEEREPGVYEIVLAAVDEAYRMTGAGLSLYTYLVKDCRKAGGRILYGWISSVNMAVLNLYAGLGASFSEPSDIFLKQLKE